MTLIKKGENYHYLREFSMKIYLVSKQITVLLTNSPICTSRKRIKASSRRKVLVRLLTSTLIILRVMAFSWTSQFVSKHGFFPRPQRILWLGSALQM